MDISLVSFAGHRRSLIPVSHLSVRKSITVLFLEARGHIAGACDSGALPLGEQLTTSKNVVPSSVLSARVEAVILVD